jgi:predicted membrane chloride channel (bestrophin family)
MIDDDPPPVHLPEGDLPPKQATVTSPLQNTSFNEDNFSKSTSSSKQNSKKQGKHQQMMNGALASIKQAVVTVPSEKMVKPLKKGAAKAASKLPFIPSRAKEYTWTELQDIETRRRKVLPRVSLGFWETLAQWDGTCLGLLVKDALLWVTITLYIVVRLSIRYGSVPTFVDSLGTGDMTVLGGFLTFFLVLFVNKSHSRYFEEYNKSMACKGRIFDVATLAITYLPKPTAMRLVRYMNAAHISGYVGLNKTYPASTFFTKMNDDFGLLTDRELARMNDIDLDQGGSANRELIVWSMRIIRKCHDDGVIDNELSHQLRTQLLQLRAAIGQLYNAADLPVPFFYVHFICLLTAMYLPIFAISVAFKAGTGDDVYWTADLVGGLMVLFQSMFVIGLRILGQEMSDPFGDDLIDLSVIFYCTFTWRMSNRILEASYDDGDVDDGEEIQLKREQKEHIGEAWEMKESDVEVFG